MTERWHVRAVPLPDGVEPVDLWVADGRIAAAPVDGAVDLPGAFVAPGLVDAHVHLTFETSPRLGLPRGSAELIAAHLEQHRRAGVLAVRDAGSVPGAALPEGVIGCGPFLAPPDFFLAHLYEGTPPEDAVTAARARVRDGWRWVKVVGDFPAGEFNPLQSQVGYPAELVAEIAAAVHDEGGRLALHVMGPFVREAVSLGVDSIEHGTWADDATVREMAARGVAWTPTLTTVLHHLEPVAEHVPPVRDLLDAHARSLALAAELGVTLLTGTDEREHGSAAAEAAALVRYGVPPSTAIAAATTGARAYFGLPGLGPGAPADLVAFARDPRADIAALAEPAAVIAGGQRVP
jgi:imidazolonepropionase-like amidohydrolase